MLIRSQDKVALVNLNDHAINVEYERDGEYTIYASYKYYSKMGTYSSEEKAIKVLDMIQEAYADAALISMTVPNIGKMFTETSTSKENELLAEAIGKALMNKMVFQMPEDSEVEV